MLYNALYTPVSFIFIYHDIDIFTSHTQIQYNTKDFSSAGILGAAKFKGASGRKA